MLDEHGNAILLDFGLSKVLDENRDLFKTKSSVIKGTNRLHVARTNELDNKSHFGRALRYFSLGIVFYELLAGEHPFMKFTHNNSLLLPQAISEHTPQSISKLCGDLPPV